MTAHYGPSLPSGHQHTPAELADLTVLRRRQQECPDDSAPMVRVTYPAGRRAERVMPWREAMEIEE